MRKRLENTDVNGWAGMPRLAKQTETLGWAPLCKCHERDEKPSPFPRFSNGWFQDNEHAIPVPCVVLDPFAGSGTTLMVSRALGRDAIGIDISEDYRKLAEERVGKWQEFAKKCGVN
jgi:hypothetical protein